MFKFCQNNVLKIFFKNYLMKIILKLSIFVLFISSYSYSNEVKVFEFTEKELSELQVRKVRGADNKTIYTLGSNDNGNYYKAIADNAA